MHKPKRTSKEAAQKNVQLLKNTQVQFTRFTFQPFVNTQLHHHFSLQE